MKMIRNKAGLVSVLFTYFMCLCLTSCSGDEPGNPGKDGFAPDSLKIGQWVNYWGYYYENGTKYSAGNDGIKIVSSTKIETSWNAQVATYKYTKTGKNTAILECHTYSPIGTHDAVTIDDVLELNFYNSSEFTFTGSRTKQSALVNGFYKLTGSGLISDKYVTGTNSGNKDDDKEEDEDFSVSAPIIDNVQMNSAVVKGTILGDVKFQERGVVYSTQSNPTVDDNVVKSNTDVVNAELKDLFEGTKYYVRLYAIVNNKVTYGEEVSFKTLGNQSSNIELSQSNPYASFSVFVNAKLPNDVKKYGLCWSTSPNPKITDNSIEEEDRATYWEIEDLQPATKYYIRAYHINGSNIVYYENSEIEAFTMGGEYPTIDVEFVEGTDNDTDADITNIDYKNFPDGTYEVSVYIYKMGKDMYETLYKSTSFVEGVSGQLFVDSYKLKNGNTTSSPTTFGFYQMHIAVHFKNIETGNKYCKLIKKHHKDKEFSEIEYFDHDRWWGW